MCYPVCFSRALSLRSLTMRCCRRSEPQQPSAFAFSRGGREQCVFITEMHCAAVQLQLYFSFPDVVSFELGHGEAGLSLGSSVSGAGATAGSSTGGSGPSRPAGGDAAAGARCWCPTSLHRGNWAEESLEEGKRGGKINIYM